MTPKRLMIALALLVVSGIYYYLYGDMFAKKPILVRAAMQPLMRRPPDGGPLPKVVIFTFEGMSYKLTSLQVIPLADLATNKYAHPVWQLTSESNSVPIENFRYGQHIRGMHPLVKGAQPDPLLPNTGYRIIVKARSQQGEHDFTTPADLAPPE